MYIRHNENLLRSLGAPIVSRNATFLVGLFLALTSRNPVPHRGHSLSFSKLLWSISAQTDERHYCHVPGGASIASIIAPNEARVNDAADDDGINGRSSAASWPTPAGNAPQR